MGTYIKQSNGFTLIETLVSLTIVGFLIVVITQTFITTVRTNTKTELLKDIKQNGDYAVSIMTRMIQNASSISNCTGDSLTIVNGDSGATTFGCLEVSGVYRIASTSANPTSYLTSENITLASSLGACADTMSFVCSQINGQTVRVTMDFTLQQKGGSADTLTRASMPFQTTAQLRNITY